jgi:hypothetical protein
VALPGPVCKVDPNGIFTTLDYLASRVVNHGEPFFTITIYSRGLLVFTFDSGLCTLLHSCFLAFIVFSLSVEGGFIC